MKSKVSFNDVLTGKVTVNKNLAFDSSQFLGLPHDGVRLIDVHKSFKTQYLNGQVVPGSQDTSRVTKLTFTAQDYFEINRNLSDAEDGRMSVDDANSRNELLPKFDISIDNEDDCNEFLNLYSGIVNDLESGKTFDVSCQLNIIPKWNKDKRAPTDLGVSFDDIENIKLINRSTKSKTVAKK